MNHLRRPGPSRAGRHGKAATVSRSSGVHEAHDLPDRFGYTRLAAWSRVQLGALDVADGQLAEARALPDEALDLSLAIQINRNMALCLVAFPGAAPAPGAANLDDGDVWPVTYALNLKKWSPMVEKKVAELVKAAIS